MLKSDQIWIDPWYGDAMFTLEFRADGITPHNVINATFNNEEVNLTMIFDPPSSVFSGEPINIITVPFCMRHCFSMNHNGQANFRRPIVLVGEVIQCRTMENFRELI